MKNLSEENLKLFRDRLSKAFKELRKNGYFARKNFWCCQSCAWAAIPEGEEKVVFYHNQDNRNIKEGYVYLAWSGNGNEILNALYKNNLYVQWNGKDTSRILVKFDSREDF